MDLLSKCSRQTVRVAVFGPLVLSYFDYDQRCQSVNVAAMMQSVSCAASYQYHDLRRLCPYMDLGGLVVSMRKPDVRLITVARAVRSSRTKDIAQLDPLKWHVWREMT